MEWEVYGDLLFFINFSMDFLCFFLTTKLMHRKLKLVRTLAAAAIGGVYAVLSLFINFLWIPSLMIDIGVCVIICSIAFADKNIKIRSMALLVGIYMVVSMFLGGIMTALFNMLNRSDIPFGETEHSGSMTILIFIVLSAISGASLLIGGRYIRKSSVDKCVKLNITYNGKTVELNGISDSGNLLKDPISGKRVIVADTCAVLGILPRAVSVAIGKNDISALSKLSTDAAKRIRLIPSTTAAGEKVLYGIIPDKIIIEFEDKSHEVDALFAPASISGAGGEFNALVPNELLL